MSRNHQRAARAHDHVESIRAEIAGMDGKAAETLKRGFGAICHKLPILIHNEGLAVALHFTAGREPGKRRMLCHLAEQLEEGGMLEQPTASAFLAQTLKADLAQTQTLTREVQRCLDWYKRFAKSVLKLESGQEDGE